MKKGFLVFYVVLSLIVFFTGIQSLFSGYGGKVGKAGDIVTCQKCFTTCTEGACTASSNFVARNCNLYNCKDKWGDDLTIYCDTPDHGGGGSSDWGDNCDPVMSEIYGECIIVPPRI